METIQENPSAIWVLVEKVLQWEEYKKLDEDRKMELLKKIPKIIKKRKINLSTLSSDDKKEQIIKELIKEETSISWKFIIKTTLSALSAVLLPIIIGTMFSTQQPKYQKDTIPDNWDNPTERTIPAKQPIPTEQITDTTDLHIDSLPLEEYQQAKQAIEECLRRCSEPMSRMDTVWL